VTHDEPASDAPESLEVLEPSRKFFDRKLRFDADDFAHGGPHR
jgi:hypothetical protein